MSDGLHLTFHKGNSTQVDSFQRNSLQKTLRALDGLDFRDDSFSVQRILGGHVNRVYRVCSDSIVLIAKEVLHKYDPATGITLTSSRSQLEYEVLRFLNSILPGTFPKPLLLDKGTNLILMEPAPPGSQLLENQLLDGLFDSVTAAKLGYHMALLHLCTAFRNDLKKQFANNKVLQFKLNRQCFAVNMNARDVNTLRHSIQRLTATKIALVHGDLCPKNVLVRPDGMLLVDLEEAHYGNPAFDIAYAIAHYWLIGIVRSVPSDAYCQAIECVLAEYTRHVGSRLPPLKFNDIVILVSAFVLSRLDGPARPSWCPPNPQTTRARGLAADLLRLRADAIVDVLLKWTIAANSLNPRSNITGGENCWNPSLSA